MMVSSTVASSQLADGEAGGLADGGSATEDFSG